MSKTLMLSSLIGAVLTLGAASYKTMEVVEAIHCKTFPQDCGRGVEAIAKTVTQPAVEAARQLAAE